MYLFYHLKALKRARANALSLFEDKKKVLYADLTAFSSIIPILQEVGLDTLASSCSTIVKKTRSSLKKYFAAFNKQARC